MSPRLTAWSLVLVLLTMGSTAASAKRWVEVKAFSRFILYIDVDSIHWQDKNHAELFQMTVLTEEGRRYFKEGYEGLNIPDVPPYAVVTWECYLKDRRRMTASRVFLDAYGDVALRSDVPTEYESIGRGSLYEAVWLYLFEPEARARSYRAWQRRVRAQGLMPV